jgi:hypothetical protein
VSPPASSAKLALLPSMRTSNRGTTPERTSIHPKFEEY